MSLSQLCWWDTVSGVDVISIIAMSIEVIFSILILLFSVRTSRLLFVPKLRLQNYAILVPYKVAVILIIATAFLTTLFCVVSTVLVQFSTKHLALPFQNLTFFWYYLSLSWLYLLFLTRLMFIVHESMYGYSRIVHYVLVLPLFGMLSLSMSALPYIASTEPRTLNVAGASLVIHLLFYAACSWLIVLFVAKLKLLSVDDVNNDLLDAMVKFVILNACLICSTFVVTVLNVCELFFGTSRVLYHATNVILSIDCFINVGLTYCSFPFGAHLFKKICASLHTKTKKLCT